MKLTTDEFVNLVEEAIESLPESLRPYMEDVIVDVEPMPSREDCREAEVDDPRDLLGLYHGVPLTERSVEMDMMHPQRVTIYQRNIERMCRTRAEVVEQVRTTVLHEVGHHFGLDEDDLFELGYD